MDLYLGVKLLHIVSTTLLFGTGLGTAFFMYRAYRAGDAGAMRLTTGHVVLADWLFTTPAVVLQLVTGLWLTDRLGVRYDSVWFVSVIALYVGVGACWLPVVRIQIRIRDSLRQGSSIADVRPLMRTWIALGLPAFLAVLVLFALMVYRPWIDRPAFGG